MASITRTLSTPWVPVQQLRSLKRAGALRPQLRPLQQPRQRLCQSMAGNDSEPSPEDYSQMASRLNQLLVKPSITGRQLRELVMEKWGRSYDVRLHKRGNRMYLQVMWKFLEQQSFPLTEEEYMQQLDAVAEYLTDWGVVETVRQGIINANKRGPGYTGGTSARCIAIPLDVDLSGARKAEWS